MISPFLWSGQQSLATLNALWTIATLNGTAAAAGPEKQLIEGIRINILRHQIASHPNVRFHPAQLAEAVQGDEHRSRVAQLVALLPFAIRPYSGAKSYIAEKFLDVLGKDLHSLEDFMGARQKQSRSMEYCALRKMGSGLYPQQHGILRELQLLRLVDEASGDREQLTRYRALEAYPNGSLGRAFWDFYAQFNWPLPGDPLWVSEDLTVRHDLVHVLCDYDVSINGEFLVSAFAAGNSERFNWMIAMLGFTPPYISTGEQFRAEDFFTAYMRGATASHSFVDQWDFWPLMEQQMGDLRNEFFLHSTCVRYEHEPCKELAALPALETTQVAANGVAAEEATEGCLLPGFEFPVSGRWPSEQRIRLGKRARKR